MCMDLSHFSLHFKLPFLILGIEVLNNIDFKVRKNCRLPHTCPQLFYHPLRLRFSQNLFLEDVNLLYDPQEGRKLVVNTEKVSVHTVS